jgi:hypothetical protein
LNIILKRLQVDGQSVNQFDKMEIRCPRLGHELTFAYCRREGGDLPCPRAMQCWEPLFPVGEHLREILTPGEWERFVAQAPQDKRVSLFDLIERARTRVGGKDGTSRG